MGKTTFLFQTSYHCWLWIYPLSDAEKFKEEFERCQQRGVSDDQEKDSLSSEMKTLKLGEGGGEGEDTGEKEEDTSTQEEKTETIPSVDPK